MVEDRDDDEAGLGFYMRGLMAQLDMSAKDLSQETGLALSTIYTYLNGRASGERPHRGTIEKLANALKVDASDFYAIADRADAQGEHRLRSYYRRLPSEQARAEAIEAVRRIMLRRPNG